MIQSRSAAKQYFKEALSKSDYFLGNQELPGFWQGRLAERLNLDGVSMQKAFDALCDNLNPHTGKNLTPRTDENRTVGYDINFHCPKSVSIFHAFSGDNHILNAFQQSVTKTMHLIEADTQTRVRLQGRYEDRQAHELAWAHFTHQTARPVNGMSPDPHLHSHCFVFNATYDETEGRIKAAKFQDIKRDMPYYQAHFHKNFSDKLAELGYGIRKTGLSFELDGVPEAVIGHFSKRTDEIGRIAEEMGITSAKGKDAIGAHSRAKKQAGSTMEALCEAWREQIQDLEVGKEARQELRGTEAKVLTPYEGKDCIDQAKHHSFERASVIAERRLLAKAYSQAIGTGLSSKEIDDVLASDKSVIRVLDGGQMKCTTKEVLLEEKQMVELARKGKGAIKPLYAEAPQLGVTGKQAAAVAHVLTTADRVSIIRGVAGTGKTTLMVEAVEKMNAAGKQVIVAAPGTDTANNTLPKAGFGNAMTVARLLSDPSKQEQLKNQVLWIDEAGQLGTQDMLKILRVAQESNAQVILGGDTRQHAAVVRGDALRVLNTVAGIKAAEVNKIYRQQNLVHKEAVAELARGNVATAFEKLDQMEAIKMTDPKDPTKDLVDDYIASVKNGEEALLISPTHAQGDEVTAKIRERLREEGLLGKRETMTRQLRNLNMTEAERQDARNYTEGDFVKFNQNAKGFRRGSQWEIVAAGEDIVRLQNRDGETGILPLAKAGKFGVYLAQDIGLSKGDKMRFTDNSFDLNGKRLNNGTIAEVVKVAEGKIFLQNKVSGNNYEVRQDCGLLAYAHCMTSHASQGKTVDKVFIYQPGSTFGATNAKQFYVSVSRAKQGVTVYTDDREELLEHAMKLGDRQGALELVGRNRMHLDFVIASEIEQYRHLENERELER
ncbi:MobF family relaxase [Flavobacterium sp. 3HN19-14]|uniref:MobF family relaxase n=1 Tax=Flavobacterium sp. 3HN19-14 TaxID=3448133 RepID=UPI003EDF543E